MADIFNILISKDPEQLLRVDATALLQHPLDIVLLDVRLPGMGDIETCEQRPASGTLSPPVRLP